MFITECQDRPADIYRKWQIVNTSTSSKNKTLTLREDENDEYYMTSNYTNPETMLRRELARMKTAETHDKLTKSHALVPTATSTSKGKIRYVLRKKSKR